MIHRGSFRQRVQKFFSGVPAEIFVNPPSGIEKYFTEEHAVRRPLTAHMLATGFVVTEQTEYPAMSGPNTIRVTTVLLEARAHQMSRKKRRGSRAN